MNLDELSGISESLPEGFPFYSFGAVTRAGEAPCRELTTETELKTVLGDKVGVSFRLLGKRAALLVVLFDETLDVSMYCELGNILASKLCQKLSETGEGDLMITPPFVLGNAQLARLTRAGVPCVHRSYRHVDGERTVVLETLILPIAGEERGNA